jgi:hypothetical protein
MSSPSKISTPVQAGKVGVFFDAKSKVITHFASFPQAGNIVSSLAVIVGDNAEDLKAKIASAGLIERK